MEVKTKKETLRIRLPVPWMSSTRARRENIRFVRRGRRAWPPGRRRRLIASGRRSACSPCSGPREQGDDLGNGALDHARAAEPRHVGDGKCANFSPAATPLAGAGPATGEERAAPIGMRKFPEPTAAADSLMRVETFTSTPRSFIRFHRENSS